MGRKAQNQVTGSPRPNPITKFDWVVNWAFFDKEKKLKLYDEFACHEVNLFLRFRDKKFFEEVVAPFISNKIEKTFIDHFLLNNNEKMKEFSTI